MASGQEPECGYDYQFVETPPDELVCLICTFVARDPQQLVCCGRVFCKRCLSKQQRYSTNCPQCRQPSNGFSDTRSDRNIKALKVICSNNKKGCLWTGDLRSVEEHNDVCDYSLIQCPNRCAGSHKNLLRKNLQDHLSKCPKRRYKCPHCQTSHYLERTTTHLKKCPQVEVPCPNHECSEKIVRCDLDYHRSTTCRFEVVKCKKYYLGCKERFPRKDLQNHVENHCRKRNHTCPHCMKSGLYDVITGRHLNTCPQVEVPCPNQPQGCSFTPLRCKVDQHRHVCKYEIVACKYAEIGCVSRLERKDMPAHENNVQEHFPIAMETIRTLKNKDSRSAAFNFKLTGFNEHKTKKSMFNSEPFYTHPGGYKMCIRVYANGSGNGKGTHVSVFAYIMKGENDDNLPWPFTGTVIIRLLNQLEDNNHHIVEVQYDSDIRGSRVQDDKERGKGFGHHKFISHTALDFNSTKNCQYLKHDCLYFRVDTANVNQGCPWLLC